MKENVLGNSGCDGVWVFGAIGERKIARPVGLKGNTKDGLLVQSSCCLFRGLRIGSQHAGVHSQLSVTVVQGFWCPLLASTST